MIRIEGLAFRYRDGDFRLRLPALEIDQGASAAVVGPSGSGKTTLLNLVAGIALPEAGRIEVAGAEVTAMGERQRRDFRIARIGMVFQEFELLDYLTVFDNILLPYRITDALRLESEVRDRAASLAEGMDIGDKLRRKARRLSQGERQRVAVCRALVTQPRLLLADEPTGNLDPANKGRVLDLLLEQAGRSDATLLTVTHDHGLLARFERVLDTREWGAS